MPMISDFKNNMSQGKSEIRMKEKPSGNNSLDVKSNNLKFAEFMHRKLQDLDLMLMKDKGATTITKISLHFDDRIRGRLFLKVTLVKEELFFLTDLIILC